MCNDSQCLFGLDGIAAPCIFNTILTHIKLRNGYLSFSIQLCVLSAFSHVVMVQSFPIAMQAHMQDTPAQQELARAQLGWEPWSGTLYPGQGSKAAAKRPALAGVSLGIQAQLGGIGVSLVAQNEELLYGRISGIQVRAVTGIARQTLELAVQHIQVASQFMRQHAFSMPAASGM